MAPQDLSQISRELTQDAVTIGRNVWTQSDLPVPKNRTLGISGVRKELETAADKLNLVQNAPDIVLQMLERAVRDYKQHLIEPLAIVKAALVEYANDLVDSGQLGRRDIQRLKSEAGQVALATLPGFWEFMLDWINNGAPGTIARSFRRSEILWVGSIVTLARHAATLDPFDVTPSQQCLAEHLLIETRYRASISRADAVLITRDPGFRYFVGGLGGKRVAYWDWARNVAEHLGLYKGQF
jgi:hypothetical protein